MPLNGLLHLQYAQHVSGNSIPIIRSSRLLCVITSYCVQCLVVGCRGQVQDNRLCVQEEWCCKTVSCKHPSSWTH